MSRNEDGPRAAVVYLRQSLDRAGTEYAVTRQREDAENLARMRGYQITAIHTDNDISAKGRARRPGFDATLTDIREGKASVIIAWSMDRLTRNARDRLRLIETGKKHKTLLALVRGSDLDLSTPSGRMTADILASVAQAEIEVKSERQIRANLQAAESGRRVGGRRPFGYEQDGKTLRIDEAGAVADGYRAYLTGSPLAAIARDWNGRGLATPQGISWAGSNVAMVLRNPRYMGWRGYAPADENRKGRPVSRLAAKAEWPAIVSEDIWHGVNAMLSKRAASTAGRGARLLLTGVAWCGLCDEENEPSTVHGGGAVRHYAMYRCSRTYGHVNRKAGPVDQWVSAYVIARLSRPDARELLSSQSGAGMAALRAEYKAVTERKKRLLRELSDDLSAEEIREINDGFRERLKVIEDQMADSGRTAVLGPLIAAGDIEALWTSMPRDHQRRVIDSLYTVTLFPAGRGTRTFRPETVRIEARWDKRPAKTSAVTDGKRRIGQ